MGYVIRIGEAEIACEDGEYRVTVRHENGGNRPLPGEMPKEPVNYRIMSGMALNYFAGVTGLESLFFIGDYRRDGAFAVTAQTLKDIDEAIARVKAEHPDAAAGPFEQAAPWHYNLHRLNWFRWWIDWALLNCERPTIFIG